MIVMCSLGGHDGRFYKSENTKRNLEYRTKPSDWIIDKSIYGNKLSESEITKIEDPIQRAVAEQDLQARQARKNFIRTVPR